MASLAILDNSRALPSPVPQITLPDDWNKESFKESIPGYGRKRCKLCSWNGDPDQLYTIDPKRGARAILLSPKLKIRSIKCVSCQILTTIVRARFSCALDRPLNGDAAPKADLSCTHQHALLHFNVWGHPEICAVMPRQTIFFPVNNVLNVEPPHGIPQLSLLDIDTSSSASLRWAMEKLANCSNSHPECGQAGGITSSFLPTRLINISSFALAGDVVLEESTNGQIPAGTRYAALSYVWGTYEPQCTTTRMTLASQLTRIPWSKLPKTFQDAVIFTRNLGIGYLWIDSICIIQEDPNDWLHEAGKMFHVYKNAYVTLAALWGTDSNSGLFSALSEWRPQLIAQITYGESCWPLYIRRIHPIFHEWEPDAEGVPLFHRAWAFQERLISPRVILFTEAELSFECLRDWDCECGYKNHPSYKPSEIQHDEKKQFFFQSVLDGSRQVRSSVFYIQPTLQNAWRTMVEAYSSLQLTVPTDRLLAIGAVAEYLQAARAGDRYLAGLWSDSLHEDLLWSLHPGLYKDAESSISSIPSWSWASVLHKCHFPSHRDDLDSTKTEIVQATCTYLGGNPFGVLETSTLIIRAPMLECWVQKVKGRRRWLRPSTSDEVCLYHTESGTMISTDCFHFDFVEYTTALQSPRRVYLLEIGTYTWTGVPQGIQCLILHRENENGNIFSRVGMADMTYNSSAGDVLLKAIRQYGTVEECTIL